MNEWFGEKVCIFLKQNFFPALWSMLYVSHLSTSMTSSAEHEDEESFKLIRCIDAVWCGVVSLASVILILLAKSSRSIPSSFPSRFNSIRFDCFNESWNVTCSIASS